MKTALVVRYGAFGDCIILTPFLRELKMRGYYVIFNASERGISILKNNPNIDEFIYYETNKVKNTELNDYWMDQCKEIRPDLYINFSETIEVKLCTHPNRAEYYLDKEGRADLCDKNYYEETIKYVNEQLGWDLDVNEFVKPELYFTKHEEKRAKRLINKKKYNILICLSGSSISKFYPWNIHLVEEIKRQHPDAHVITTGDDFSVEAENEMSPNVKLCGRVPFRISAALTKYVDLVITPDTGILHAAACYDTSKIALLGQTSKENITKHFTNCYTIEAECFCAPCFRIIYEFEECPKDETTGACLCMGYGISPFEILTAIKQFRQG